VLGGHQTQHPVNTKRPGIRQLKISYPRHEEAIFKKLTYKCFINKNLPLANFQKIKLDVDGQDHKK